MNRIIGAVAFILAFFGVGYLFEAGIIPSPFSRTFTEDEISATLQDESEMFVIMKSEFPEAYGELLTELADEQGDGNDALATAGFAFVTNFRRENADLLLAADDGQLRAVVRATAATHEAARKFLGEEVCGNFAVQGYPAIQDQADDPVVVTAMEQQGTTLFRAFASGKSTEPREVASSQDWTAVIDTPNRSPEEARRLDLVAATDPQAEGYCSALIWFFEFLADADGEAAERTRASLARDIAAS
ncbi:MAG: hypothetical protein V2I43_17395 [Parvularcula sp.]|jgi:acyl-CoA synthetase (AMP-forming)/AMP-acid ligase II|nr:hypothetical protein [Parvularcula sp.]